jgi:hypothetical protein
MENKKFKIGDKVVIYTCRGMENESISKPMTVTKVDEHFVQVNGYRSYAYSYVEHYNEVKDNEK